MSYGSLDKMVDEIALRDNDYQLADRSDIQYT